MHNLKLVPIFKSLFRYKLLSWVSLESEITRKTVFYRQYKFAGTLKSVNNYLCYKLIAGEN